MKRRRGRTPVAPRTEPTNTPAEPVDDGQLMMAVARANAANGYAWDIPAVVVTFLFVRLFGPLLGAPRRIAAGATRRIASARGISHDR
jgi:hypothetical protein